MSPHPVYAGIDVSKNNLDVFVPGQGHLQFGNTPAQIKKLLNDMKRRGVISFDLAPRKRVPQPTTRITLSEGVG